MQVSRVRRVWSLLALFLSVALLAACGSQPNPDVRTMTLTFVRHAQSEANAADVASTAVPGPPLTPLGLEQADKLANELAANRYDGVYVSAMLRSQQTAAPTATPRSPRAGLRASR